MKYANSICSDNYDIGTEEKFLDKLKKVPGIVEVNPSKWRL
jgi:hypothetical protein